MTPSRSRNAAGRRMASPEAIAQKTWDALCAVTSSPSVRVQIFLGSAAAGGEVRSQSGDGRKLPCQRGRERPAEQLLEVAGEVDRMKRIEAVVEKLQIALDVHGWNVGVAHQPVGDPGLERGGGDGFEAARGGRVGRAHATWSPCMVRACGWPPSHTSPSAAANRMSQADGSTCHQVKSLKAERGNAWWLLCHAPPSVGSASGQKLRLSSCVSYGRAPNRWHIELMLQVA